MTQCPHNEVERKVLEKIKPTQRDKEEAEKLLNWAIKLLENTLREIKTEYEEIRVEGSYAKDTWLRGDLDLDIFILLPRNSCSKKNITTLVNNLYKALRAKNITVTQEYAEHPYLSILAGTTEIEVVPACRIRLGEKPLTATDRTPLHTQYVKSKLMPEQRDEVRLFKKFLKSIGTYGAEQKVRGFSGYLVELLIVKYTCFRRALQEISDWKPPVVIILPEIRDHVKREELIQKHRGVPLIVPDPIDPERNTAAAVSYEAFSRTILASTLYLRSPSMDFFTDTLPLSINEVIEKTRERIDNIIVIAARLPTTRDEETLYGIGRRLSKTLSKILDRMSFTAIDTAVYAKRDVILVAIELVSRRPPPYVKRKGPCPWMHSNLEDYLRKSLREDTVGPWIGEDGRLYVLAKPKHQDAIDALRATEEQWKPKTLRSARIEYTSIEGLRRSSIFEELVSDKGFREWMARILLKKPHWLKI